MHPCGCPCTIYVPACVHIYMCKEIILFSEGQFGCLLHIFLTADSESGKALEFKVGEMEVKVEIEEEVNGEEKVQNVEDSDSNDKKG